MMNRGLYDYYRMIDDSDVIGDDGRVKRFRSRSFPVSSCLSIYVRREYCI